jgi:hypothetical protein
LNLEEGISKGMKKVKIENVGLGSRRALPDSKLNGKSSQNSIISGDQRLSQKENTSLTNK